MNSSYDLWIIELIKFEKEGTIFLIKSDKKGKYIAFHSKYANESEVVFPPLTKFKVLIDIEEILLFEGNLI